MVTAECHAHIFMDGVDYKKAAAAHENGPREDLIREHLAAYQKAGISYVRDGGDPYGAGVLARSLAPEYGITYRTPVFAIHRAGRYGKIVGRAFSDWKEYCALVREVRRAGGDFIKIMTTGILDFATKGHVTSEPLSREEVFAMTAAAHDAGLSVMAHVNGAQAVMDAAEAGVDSVEHGNFQNEESICCMAEHATIWVPTIVTVSNLLENGRYPAETLAWIFETQKKGLQLAFEKDVVLAAGSDAGAYGVLHGKGIREEERVMRKILGAEKWAGAGKAACVWRKKDPGKVLKIFCVSGFRKNLELNGQTMLAFSPGLW